jgi:hypothetical protein
MAESMTESQEARCKEMRIRNFEKNPPRRFEIAEYWSAKEPRFVGDLGEPSCFACHYWDETWDTHSSIVKRWEASGLERAHIVAAADDGRPTLENLLLLCRRCHIEAPMVTIPSVMIDWALHRQDWIAWSFQKAQQYMEKTISPDMLNIDFNGQEFREFLRTCGFRRHSCHNRMMAGFVPESDLALLARYLKMKTVFNRSGMLSPSNPERVNGSC